jgi:hypothetical protein
LLCSSKCDQFVLAGIKSLAVPLGDHFQLDPYYEHENRTGTNPNQQTNAGGFKLALFVPAKKR